jgi:hypothetical protein
VECQLSKLASGSSRNRWDPYGSADFKIVYVQATFILKIRKRYSVTIRAFSQLYDPIISFPGHIRQRCYNFKYRVAIHSYSIRQNIGERNKTKHLPVFDPSDTWKLKLLLKNILILFPYFYMKVLAKAYQAPGLYVFQGVLV